MKGRTNMREQRHSSRRGSDYRLERRKNITDVNETKYNFLGVLFRQIIFSALILAVLLGIKNIRNPVTEKLSSSLEYCIKYNIEYEWIVSNISKTTAYLLSMLTNN